MGCYSQYRASFTLFSAKYHNVIEILPTFYNNIHFPNANVS